MLGALDSERAGGLCGSQSVGLALWVVAGCVEVRVPTGLDRGGLGLHSGCLAVAFCLGPRCWATRFHWPGRGLRSGLRTSQNGGKALPRSGGSIDRVCERAFSAYRCIASGAQKHPCGCLAGCWRELVWVFWFILGHFWALRKLGPKMASKSPNTRLCACRVFLVCFSCCRFAPLRVTATIFGASLT